MRKQLNGGITVFLSLVILLILALIGTVIESARVNVAKAYAERSLLTAMDSEFTKYQEEMYEDYHLFLLERKLDIDTMDGDEFLDSIQEYLMYSFEPNSNLTLPGTNHTISNMNLLEIKTEDLTLVESTYVTDYNGELFLNEVTEYMKYETGAKAAELFLEKMNLLQKTKKTVSVVKEKLKVEKKLGELDKQVMNLMEHVEGITFKKSGLKFTKGGLIKAQKNFAKKFCAETITSKAVGVKHSVVWNSLKKKYINPLVDLSKIEEFANKIEKEQSDIIKLKGEIDEIKEILQVYEREGSKTEGGDSKVENEDSKVEDEDSKVEGEKQKNKYTEKEISEFQEKVKKLEKEYEEKIKKAEKDSKKQISEISKLSNGVVSQAEKVICEIDEALDIIPKMSKKRSDLTTKLDEFGGTLENSKNEIDKGVYGGLTDDLNKMENYIGSNDEGTNASMISKLVQMKPTLQNNKGILEKVRTLGDITESMSIEDVSALLKKLAEIKTSLKDYNIRKLEFDYSRLVIKPEQGSPFSIFSDLIQDGMIGLVVDDVDSISKSEMSQTGLPSELMIQAKEEQSVTQNEDTDSDNLANDLKEGDDIGYDADISGSLESYEVSCDNANIYTNTANGVVDNILLNEYAIEHFKSYTNKTTNKISLDTGLEYEQEYILCGKKSDYKNLRSVVLRTIFFRTVLNYLYLISDSSKSSMAQTTALGLVGFTCLEPLVSITKHLILITWAFEEALIDTRALLDGKEVPLLKNKDNFILKYSEMLLVNKKLIKEKSDRMPDKPKSGICFGYDDYMRVYLLLTQEEKKCYRSMDLIQQNMQIRYSKDFLMSQCVFGARVRAEYLIPSKFIKLPFVDSMLHYQDDGFHIALERDYSY